MKKLSHGNYFKSHYNDSPFPLCGRGGGAWWRKGGEGGRDGAKSQLNKLTWEHLTLFFWVGGWWREEGYMRGGGGRR